MFQSGGNVHTGPVQVVLFCNHVANVDANAKLHAPVFRNRGVAIRKLVLYLDGTANGIDDAVEFSDNAVSGGTEDATAMGDNRPLHHSTVRAQCGGGRLFVKLHKMTVSGHIGSENRDKPTFHDQGTPL